jgi:ankyrin repeat protein
VVKLLLEEGAGVKASDSDGKTPLDAAAQNAHAKVVKLLLEQGAGVKASDSDEKTPLDPAAQNAHAKVVKLLLEQGAGVKASDSDGKTPLDAAAQNGHASCYLSKGRLLKASDSECTCCGGQKDTSQCGSAERMR